MSIVTVENKGAIQATVTIYNTQDGTTKFIYVQPGSSVDLPKYHRVHQNSLVEYPKLKEILADRPVETADTAASVLQAGSVADVSEQSTVTSTSSSTSSKVSVSGSTT